MEQSLLQQDIRPCFRASAPLKLPARKLKVASAVNEVHMYWHIFIDQLELLSRTCNLLKMATTCTIGPLEQD
jgi:hypothetical protein